MTDELDQVDITWNALNAAIEALDRIRGLMPEEYDRKVGMI